MSNTNILSLSVKVTDELIRTELPSDYTDQAKAEITTNLLKHADLQDALDKIKAEYKEKMEPLVKKNKQLLAEVRAGFIDKYMNVHNVPDEDKLIIEFYDMAGKRVGERAMTLDERPSPMLRQIRANEKA